MTSRCNLWGPEEDLTVGLRTQRTSYSDLENLRRPPAEHLIGGNPIPTRANEVSKSLKMPPTRIMKVQLGESLLEGLKRGILISSCREAVGE